MREPELAIVLVAAGASTRMGFDKLWAEVSGRPLLALALEAARQAQPAELVLVVAPERVQAAAALAPEARVVVGGARRRDSVAAGLAASGAPWVAVHDAARALVAPRLFSDGLRAARSVGVAVPALPVKDTVKRVRVDRVVETVARAELRAVQTPQLFRRELLERALASTDEDVTDEAALLERLGEAVAVFAGDERNFKVTTPFDLALVRFLLDGDDAGRAQPLPRSHAQGDRRHASEGVRPRTGRGAARGGRPSPGALRSGEGQAPGA